jgi:hypothetical protein
MPTALRQDWSAAVRGAPVRMRAIRLSVSIALVFGAGVTTPDASERTGRTDRSTRRYWVTDRG